MLKVSHVIRWIARWIGQTETLLTPSSSSCLVCGGRESGVRRIPVCRRCYELIPWIHEVRCDRCGRHEECPDCPRRIDTHFTQNRSVVRYDEHMKDWLAIYKYRGKESLAKVLGPMLLHAYHMHHKGKVISDAAEWITYVPLSGQRLAERGFNQAEQLARELGRLTGIPVVPLLTRTRHTDKQSFKARAERLDDMLGVFAPDLGQITPIAAACRKGQVRLYLVDDVYTTGSTFNECARTIRTILPVRVYGISWAR
ncbi:MULTISPECIES: ComF family protein [unclassified Paenibacillus]|uniref:ComF family protein n=1 Tax=unclassified Paenibacillus TaxID=185978 RepID=UPI001B7536ED|nr:MULTISPECIES: ComF family protein [unclassified Paenibacillus]MBP1157810.1 ComF family protein [Paenibacillus sp. PvP091]MBP1171454.1 ComF family protein [Paenibacillus sp. PvR098]MBP2442482.1 ComF family protein [Paenibacillus sp. PvP052]